MKISRILVTLFAVAALAAAGYSAANTKAPAKADGDCCADGSCPDASACCSK